MPSISRIVEETSFNLDQFVQLIDSHLEKIAHEKTMKFAELQPMLVDTEVPPGVLFTALLATLRRTYNHDQLTKARYYLTIAREAVEKMDDLPYVWNAGQMEK